MIEPIYTPTNCTPAFELRWSLALFANEHLPAAETWIETLKERVERDGVRLLEYRFKPPNVWFFLLSTKVHVAPPAIVKSIKGRLQNLVQNSIPKAFRRNFSLTSVGHVKRDIVDGYVASQLGHHSMASSSVQRNLSAFQLEFPEVDLAAPQLSSHGRYIYNLHLVLVHDLRWNEVRDEYLASTRDVFLKAVKKKEHRLSRLSLVPDQLHVTIGCRFNESPQDVTLSYMNNISYSHGMTPLFRFGYYAGTFGEYDMGAIWENLPEEVAVSRRFTDAGSGEAGDAESFARSSGQSSLHRRGVERGGRS